MIIGDLIDIPTHGVYKVSDIRDALDSRGTIYDLIKPGTDEIFMVLESEVYKEGNTYKWSGIE